MMRKHVRKSDISNLRLGEIAYLRSDNPTYDNDLIVVTGIIIQNEKKITLMVPIISNMNDPTALYSIEHHAALEAYDRQIYAEVMNHIKKDDKHPTILEFLTKEDTK